jgi:hypothetical protein
VQIDRTSGCRASGTECACVENKVENCDRKLREITEHVATIKVADESAHEFYWKMHIRNMNFKLKYLNVLNKNAENFVAVVVLLPQKIKMSIFALNIFLKKI